MRILTAICPCLLTASLAMGDGLDDTKFLHAIAMVETGCDYGKIGDKGRSFGAFQMQKEAIKDANDHRVAIGKPRIAVREMMAAPYLQVTLASTYLTILRAKFLTAGVKNPTPAQLAVSWNKGFEAARSTGFAPTDYSNRVCNILSTIK